MRIAHCLYTSGRSRQDLRNERPSGNMPVVAFGGRPSIGKPAFFAELRKRCPDVALQRPACQAVPGESPAPGIRDWVITAGIEKTTTRPAVTRVAGVSARYTVRNTVNKPELALPISGVGRKVVLHNRSDEAIRRHRSIRGEAAAPAGCRTSGEIAPLRGSARSRYRTMRITTFAEK